MTTAPSSRCCPCPPLARRGPAAAIALPASMLSGVAGGLLACCWCCWDGLPRLPPYRRANEAWAIDPVREPLRCGAALSACLPAAGRPVESKHAGWLDRPCVALACGSVR